MKNVYTLLLLLSFTSCISHKEVVHTVHEEQWERLSNERDSILEERYRKQQEEWWEYVESYTEEETVIRYYDTSKPVDSITGAPPLEKEVVKKKSYNANSKKAVASESEELSSSVEVKDSIEDSSGESMSAIYSKREVISSPANDYIRYIIWLSIIVGVIIISRYVYNILKILK